MGANLSLNQTFLIFWINMDKLGRFDSFYQFLSDRLPLLDLKGFFYWYIWSYSICGGCLPFAQGLSLTVYVEGGLPFAPSLSLENSEDSSLFSTNITTIGVFFLFLLWITIFIFVYCFWCYLIYHRRSSPNYLIC